MTGTTRQPWQDISPGTTQTPAPTGNVTTVNGKTGVVVLNGLPSLAQTTYSGTGSAPNVISFPAGITNAKWVAIYDASPTNITDSMTLIIDTVNSIAYCIGTNIASAYTTQITSTSIDPASLHTLDSSAFAACNTSGHTYVLVVFGN